MKRIYRLGLLGGLTLLIGLVVVSGLPELFELLRRGGARLLLLSAFSLPVLLIGTASWRCLWRPPAPRFSTLLRSLWLGTAVNTLLPSGGIGGEFARARVLCLDGVALSEVAASLVVDRLVQAVSLVLLIVAGVAALISLSAGGHYGWTAGLLGLGLVAAIAAAVWLVRSGATARLGEAWLARTARTPGWARGIREVEQGIHALLGRPAALCSASGVRFLGRLLLAGEVWLAAYWMGVPIGIGEAVAIQCLSFAVRGVAFFVPAGIGVQEGSAAVVALWLGLPAELGISLTLATRLREWVVGLPALIEWQRVETLRAFGAPEASTRGILS